MQTKFQSRFKRRITFYDFHTLASIWEEGDSLYHHILNIGVDELLQKNSQINTVKRLDECFWSALDHRFIIIFGFPPPQKDKTIAWLAPVIYCHRVRPLRNSENFRTNFQNYLTFESLFNDDDVIARIIFQRRTVLQQYFRMLQNDLLVYSNMNTIWMAKGSL